MLLVMSTRKHHRPQSLHAHAPTSGKNGSYWLYGTHAVSAALANPRRCFEHFVALPQALDRFAPLASKPIERVEAGFFEKNFGADAVHQGIAALVRPLPDIALEEVLESAVQPLVLLDQVTDPHNVGAILRSAAAFNASAVILPKDHAPPEGAVLAKAASGALELIPMIRVTNLVKSIETIKKSGYWIAGLEGEAMQTMQEAKLTLKTALVLGAEGKGMRRLTREHCDLTVKLPISSKMESLNVSNAAAVALYELMRSGT